MNTAKVYIAIPYVTPALEIDCSRSNATTYLEHLFFPYAKYNPRRNDYFKISFADCCDGKIRVYHRYSKGQEIKDIIRYIEAFIIRNAYATDGYIMLHGGAISRNGKAVAILGNSYAGKSTATAYFCAKGFEYLTDDRVLVNANTLQVMPFQRKIMLRSNTTSLLKEIYNISISTNEIDLNGIQRSIYEPTAEVTRTSYLEKIIILNRRMSGGICSDNLKQGEALETLMMYGMNVKNYMHIDRYRKISRCGVSEVYYSNLLDLEKYVLEVLT